MGKSKILKGALIMAAVMCLSVLPQSEFSVYATDFDSLIAEQEEKALQLKKDNEKREQEISGISGDIAENEEKMDLITEQIQGVKAEIDAYGQRITFTQDKIKVKEQEIRDIEKAIADKEEIIENKRKEISRLEAENKENLKKFAKLIRALYMNDTSDAVPLLNGSDDWYDFFVYSEVVQNISEQNMRFMTDLMDAIKKQEDLIEGLNDDIAQLNDDKSELQQRKADLETELSDLSTKKTEVQALSDEKYNELYKYASYNETLEYQVSSLKKKVNATNAEIDEANKMVEELIRQKQLELAGGPVYSSDGFRWPLDTRWQHITTYFGYDAWRGGNHYGIDVAGGGYNIGGANIYAAQGGTVITAYNNGGWNGGYGNYVIIDHGGGLSTLYAHCSSTTVVSGQVVAKGEVIGYVGTTGWSTGNHLHFETRVNGGAVNPFNYSYEYV